MKPKTTLMIVLAGAAALAFVPIVASDVMMQFAINALLLAVLAQSWNIIGGFTGYVSFGNSVFYGLGIYGTAIAMAQLHLPFAAGLVLGLALALVCALFIGLPILRLRGPYFAIATLGLSAGMGALISNIGIAGKNTGLILPLVRADPMFYWISLVLLLACTLTVYWLSLGRFGAGLVAIREDEHAAATMGVNTTLYKVLALMLSAAFTAVAGGIYAYWISFIDPSSAFDPTLNVRMVIMAVFGGTGTVLGPLIGSFLLSAVYEILSSWISTAAALIFGLVIVLAVIYAPGGLVDVVAGVRRSGWRYLTQNIRENRL